MLKPNDKEASNVSATPQDLGQPLRRSAIEEVSNTGTECCDVSIIRKQPELSATEHCSERYMCNNNNCRFTQVFQWHGCQFNLYCCCCWIQVDVDFRLDNPEWIISVVLMSQECQQSPTNNSLLYKTSLSCE